MELILLIAGILVALVLYFCFGIALKFLVSWWILLLGTPVLIGVGFLGGCIGAVVALVGFGLLLHANNSWSGSQAYRRIEKQLDKAFCLGDI